MSQTEPMDEATRLQNYERQGRKTLTSVQRRRLRQKLNKAVAGVPAYVDEFLDHPETGVRRSRPAKKEVSE